MDIQDRATAIRALASCDQMEAFLTDGEEQAMEAISDMARDFVDKLDIDGARVILKCLRARANEVLAFGTYS